MKRNPYEVLGVAANASPEEIRKAYRKMARKNHPDSNPGDDFAVQRYHDIQEAYNLLSDQDRRQHFDETGEESPPPPSNDEIEFMRACYPFLTGVVKGFVEEGHSIEKHDILKEMKSHMMNHTTELKKTIKLLEKNKKALGEVVKRMSVKKKGEQNLLALAAERHIELVERDSQKAQAELRRTLKAIKDLKKYHYTFEKIEIVTTWTQMSSFGFPNNNPIVKKYINDSSGETEEDSEETPEGETSGT